MEDMLVWQYDQMTKELLLLQEHIADSSCPCETENEFCVRKHLMTIEAYAEETYPMEKDEALAAELRQLAREAKQLRTEEEAIIRKDSADSNPVPSEWPRSWRKKFERISLGFK